MCILHGIGMAACMAACICRFYLPGSPVSLSLSSYYASSVSLIPGSPKTGRRKKHERQKPSSPCHMQLAWLAPLMAAARRLQWQRCQTPPLLSASLSPLISLSLSLSLSFILSSLLSKKHMVGWQNVLCRLWWTCFVAGRMRMEGKRQTCVCVFVLGWVGQAGHFGGSVPGGRQAWQHGMCLFSL